LVLAGDNETAYGKRENILVYSRKDEKGAQKVEFK